MRRHGTSIALVLVAMPVVFQSPAATAGPVPGYSYSSSGTGTSLLLIPDPTVTVTDTASFGYSILNYFFEVSGPQNISMDVDVSGSLYASETFTGPNVAAFGGSLPLYDELAALNVGTSSWVTGSPGPIFAGIGSGGTRSGINGSNVGGQLGYAGTPVTTVTDGTDTVTTTTQLALDGSLMVDTNTVYDVELYAALGGYYDTPGSLVSSGTVYVDPYITIDPASAASNPDYSLILSAGVGNVSPVPEPSTMVLFGLGLAALGLTRRRSSNGKT